MTLTLFRAEQTPDGVFGRLTGAGLSLHTLEDSPWDDGKGYAILSGDYVCRRTRFYRGGYETFEVCDVPGRSRILFHIGNTEEDTLGCILVGMRRGWLLVPDEDVPGSPVTEKRAVVESAKAFRLFMDALGAVDAVDLKVEWGPGLPEQGPGL